MNYQKIYDAIVEFRKVNVPNGYTEVHHILPRSLGGSNNSDNLVRLTAREHFVCHLLLTKIKLPQYKHAKMVRAFMFMLASNSGQQRYFSSRNYKKLREEFADLQSKAQSGLGNSQHGTKWIHNVELRLSKKIKKCEDIPEGWEVGRVLNFDLAKIKIDARLSARELLCASRASSFEKFLQDKEERTRKKAAQTIAYTEQFKEWYAIYAEKGYDEFCEITGYDKSKPNLVMRFAKYVPEFVPQNGKARKKNM